MGEIKLEQYFRKRVEKRGGLCLKFVSPSRRGVCDRLVISENGLTYYVEMKFGKNGLSPAQKLFKKELEMRGVPVYVLATKEQVDYFMENIYF